MYNEHRAAMVSIRDRLNEATAAAEDTSAVDEMKNIRSRMDKVENPEKYAEKSERSEYAPEWAKKIAVINQLCKFGKRPTNGMTTLMNCLAEFGTVVK
jgi:hypothetical protein